MIKAHFWLLQEQRLDFEMADICSSAGEQGFFFYPLIMSPYSSPMALRDYLKPYLRLLGAWDRKHLYALCRSMLQSRSAILSRSARTRLKRKDGMRARLDNWVKRMSALLEFLPWQEFHAIHERRLRDLRQDRWTMVIHDTSDIAKPYSEKLPGLSTVHDGSTGTLVPGYIFCLSVGVGKNAWDIHPIAGTLLHPHAEDFRSQGASFRHQIGDMLSAGIGQDCLHVFDRGFDDEKYFHFLDGGRIAWLIRMQDKRIVTFRGEKHRIIVVAETILAERPLAHEDITYARTDIGITLNHDALGRRILPETRTYALVAVRRSQFLKPMLLLVNGRVKDLREAVKLYSHYLDRWDVEDCIRFLKQSLRTEQMQLRSFERLSRLLHLQILLVDFLLREYDKGVRPPGAELREMLLRSIDGDTRIVSPYLLADHIGDSLLLDQRQRDPDLVPRPSPQLSLLPIMDAE